VSVRRRPPRKGRRQAYPSNPKGNASDRSVLCRETNTHELQTGAKSASDVAFILYNIDNAMIKPCEPNMFSKTELCFTSYAIALKPMNRKAPVAEAHPAKYQAADKQSSKHMNPLFDTASIPQEASYECVHVCVRWGARENSGQQMGG
jgi:hypothetical protein